MAKFMMTGQKMNTSHRYHMLTPENMQSPRVHSKSKDFGSAGSGWLHRASRMHTGGCLIRAFCLRVMWETIKTIKKKKNIPGIILENGTMSISF